MGKKFRILVALDFTERPDDIVQKSILVASRYNAHISLIHVMTDIPRMSFYSDTYELWEEFRDITAKRVLEEMHQYIKRLSDKFKDIEPIVEVGDPAEKIIETADKLAVDLIIVGNHSRKGIERLVHRNVSEKVMRMSKRDVLSFYAGG
jgi:nucleotide-binding universal stress UspA family protein